LLFSDGSLESFVQVVWMAIRPNNLFFYVITL